MNNCRRLATALLATWSALLAGCVVVPPGEQPLPVPAEQTTDQGPADGDGEAVASLPGLTGRKQATHQLTASLLQSELLAFADRYLEAVAEAADWGADHTADPKARAAFRQTKVVYATAAVTVVTEPDPLRVLRDLIVMVRLQKLVWDEGRFAWPGAEATERMQHALTRLDTQINQLAGRVVPAAAIAMVQEATAQWHAANPERRYVSFVRFHDLGDADFRKRFEQVLSTASLLAPVAEATREIHETRRVAERAIFLANHMPVLLEWQAEGLVYHALRIPETQEVLADLNRFTATAEGVGKQIALMPEHVAAERRAALAQLDTLLADQRTQALAAIDSASGELLPLAQQLATTATALEQAMTLVTAMSQAPDQPGDFTLRDFAGMVDRMVVLAGNAAEVMRITQALAEQGPSAAGTSRLDQLLREHELRLFGYLCALLVLLGMVLCVVALVWRRNAPRGQ